MSIPRFVVWMFPVGMMVLGAGVASGQNVVWLAPFLRANVPWDPVKDFSPITLITKALDRRLRLSSAAKCS
mgnify:CR=1 FL=1